MNLHANAKLGPSARYALVSDVEGGLPTVVGTGYRASATPAGRLCAMTSAHVIAGVAPVAARRQVAEHELAFEPE
jgi:hypothetical protein